MTASARVRLLGLLVLVAAFGCQPSPAEKDDPIAETQRMLKEAERTVRESDGASPNAPPQPGATKTDPGKSPDPRSP